jgi:hypothetical protein
MEWMRNRYSMMMRSGRARLDGRSKGHNFRSDRWIAIKLLLEFPDAVFHEVDEGSILGDDEVWSSQAGWTGRKAITFDPTVGSRSNFYWSFRMPFSTHWMRNRYSVMMRSGRARLDGWSKGHNFRSDRWIAIKLLLEFPDTLFHGVDEGSILGNDEVWSIQA